jgi:hypothetical protein
LRWNSPAGRRGCAERAYRQDLSTASSRQDGK